MNVKDWTAEIDREADLIAARGQGNGVGRRDSERGGDVDWRSDREMGVSREQAGSLGNRALYYDADAQQKAENAIELNRERVLGAAERDNGTGTEYREGASTVGVEGKFEAEQNRVADMENLRNELYPHIDGEAELAVKTQEERGSKVMRLVDKKFLGRPNYKVSDLVGWYNKQRNDMLLDFENPRRIGDRN